MKSARARGAGVDQMPNYSLPALDLEPGNLFARRYQVFEELGVGGMGRVYRVLDRGQPLV